MLTYEDYWDKGHRHGIYVCPRDQLFAVEKVAIGAGHRIDGIDLLSDFETAIIRVFDFANPRKEGE